MKQRLYLLITFFLSIAAYAQDSGLKGTVIDANTGRPLQGVVVTLKEQGLRVVSAMNGEYVIATTILGGDLLIFTLPGFQSVQKEVQVKEGSIQHLEAVGLYGASVWGETENEYVDSFEETLLTDDEGNQQAISNLSGASEDVYLNTAGYALSALRFRVRGYNLEYAKTYINGIEFNEPARGRFSFSMLGGMNQAFRSKNSVMGSTAAGFTFGDIGGSTNITTKASEYAPSTRVGVGYTNRNYNYRATITHATGLTPSGWALVASTILRTSKEGVVEGTYYQSWGFMVAAQKIFNQQHNLNITAFAAPTRLGQAAASFEESYELTGNNLYNPNWGYQNGKKRNSREVESFTPTLTLSWEWKPQNSTTVNNAFGVRYSSYASSALNWYDTADPRPDYYRRLPSYFGSGPVFDYYTDQWQNNESFRQINWDNLYQVNQLNNWQNKNEGTNLGSSYILENRYSNQLNWMYNSNLNTRLTDILTLQAGIGVNYTQASYYKKMKDLLGGEYWLDIDQFAERDYPNNNELLQNDLNNPDRKVSEGQVFGYNYDINSVAAKAWIQNSIGLPRWDIYYGLEISYTQFERDGKYRNGRAPNNSYGKGETHRFDNGGVKAGATYKLNGRNFFTANLLYESKAPFFQSAYISPRIKDDAIPYLKSQRIVSGDLSYTFSYKKIRGRVTAFETRFFDQTEVSSFFHDQYQTFVNYVLTGVNKTHKGIEVGFAYKVYPDVTLSFAGTIAKYQYKNRPTGITNYENGSKADTIETVYLKNFYVGGTPQQAFNIAVDWAAPKRWFFNLNLSGFDKSYVSLAPVRRTISATSFPLVGNSIAEMEAYYEQKSNEITHQEKLKGHFMLNGSVGKMLYFKNSHSLNINISVNNILNTRNIQSGGYEQGRFDFSGYDVNKFPNKYFYAQGVNLFANVGYRF